MSRRDRLCLHTVTTKPWAIETALREYAAAGVAGITVWRNALSDRKLAEVGRMIADAGLTCVSLCRGGFFPSTDAAKRREAIEENERAIDEAAAIGAPHVVLVCGAEPAQPLATSREQIEEGIRALLPHAEAAGVKLAIEPLHPMYADTRSAVNTLGQANDMCASIGSPFVTVAVDVYHLWWDPGLEPEIQRCARLGALQAFHVCDWRVPTRDFLTDREIPGRGCIDVPLIRRWVEEAGFAGFIEVEIFSNEHWQRDQQTYLKEIVEAYDTAV